MDMRKVLVFSALMAMNVIVWYEVFGVGFLIALGAIIACVVAFSRGK